MSFHFQRFLNHWYRQPGNNLWLTQQEALLGQAMQSVFGFYLVQLGAPWPRDLLHDSRIDCRIIVESRPVHIEGMIPVVADPAYLPFRRESVDAVVLPHTLETVSDPYHMLRQVDQILVLDGHVIILGFNPWNMGNWRLRYAGRQRRTFAQANWIRMHRIIDWLNVLGYDIRLAQHLPMGFLPSGRRGGRWQHWRERMEFGLEKAGLHFGKLYCIVAQKRSMPLTPVGLNWKLANWLPVNRGHWLPAHRLSGTRVSQQKARHLHEES